MSQVISRQSIVLRQTAQQMPQPLEKHGYFHCLAIADAQCCIPERCPQFENPSYAPQRISDCGGSTAVQLSSKFHTCICLNQSGLHTINCGVWQPSRNQERHKKSPKNLSCIPPWRGARNCRLPCETCPGITSSSKRIRGTGRSRMSGNLTAQAL